MQSHLFYNNLKCHNNSINQLICKADIFEKLPKDWHIIVTDIKGSTQAVKNGLAQIVNLTATGSIIAALNIAAKVKIDLPFFFGGDGATILVPPNLLAEIMHALVLHQRNVKKEFNIDLRVGSLPVSVVYDSKTELKIIKLSINDLLAIPIVLGNGLQFAEKIIKSQPILTEQQTNNNDHLNLEGMECRWDTILPPKDKDEVVCLLISALKESEQAIVFKKILDEIQLAYGSHKKRNPISLRRLKLDAGFQKIKTELRMRGSKVSFGEWLKNWFFVVAGKYWYLPSKNGQKYLNELVQLSDIFVMDGRINMVVSGKQAQRKRLVAFLDNLEKNGDIIYGIHASQESVISCYVQNREAHHIHFIDGGHGGYTMAAVLLKEKMRKKGL